MKLEKSMIEEENGYANGEEGEGGYWIYLAPGFCSDEDPLCPLHTIHEYTKREAYTKWTVRRCDCDECKALLGEGKQTGTAEFVYKHPRQGTLF